MAANYDLVVIHGPPSPAVHSILRQRLSNLEEYVHVYPAQLFRDHPGFGVRDIANHALDLLKKHKKVVVEDSCAGGGVRDCLRNVIPRKLPACRVRVIQLKPRHGQEQTLWERQFFLAACQQPHLILSEKQIGRWFDEQGGFSTSQPSSSETGFKETVSADLTATTNFKFEVPCLLVQWESMVDSGGYLQDKMTAVCRQWTQVNPCGRVIAVCDGTAVAKGQMTAVQQKSQIIGCVTALANELPCPVYVLQVTSTMDAGQFSQPPSPGLLSFLHRRHCVDLHHKSTVYIYTDVRHMKMAERAGVRHMQVGKVMRSPEVMKTCHSAIVSSVPQMLRQLQLVADFSADATSLLQPSIPLFDHLGTFTDQYICVNHSRGLHEFLFAQDTQNVQRFQSLYAERATPVGEAGHRMDKQGRPDKSLEHSLETSVVNDDLEATLRDETSATGRRSIPQWMLRKRGSSLESESAKLTLEKSSSSNSVEGRGRSRHTIYIMTEKELLETAQEILKQAGRQDLMETCLLQSAEGGTTHSTKKGSGGEDMMPTLAAATGGERDAERDTAIITERDTAIITERDTAIITERDTAIITERDTAIITERDTAIITERDTAIIEPTPDTDIIQPTLDTEIVEPTPSLPQQKRSDARKDVDGLENIGPPAPVKIAADIALVSPKRQK